MIETTASKSLCSHGAASPRRLRENASTPRGGYSPFVWLNLLCLDAPIVAISWQWLFARSFGIPIAPGGTAALFLTAWFIYLADRFGDNLSLDQNVPTSLRQSFCRRYRIAWLVALTVVGLSDVFLIFAQLNQQTRLIGAGVGAFACLYLIVNQFESFVWRWLPLKEISIGFLFAAGTIVALANGLTSASMPAWIFFACLCSLNCISIAVSERELDHAQGRISIATTFPRIGRVLLLLLLFFGLTSLALAAMHLPMRNLYGGISTSAILLAVVHYFRNGIQSDIRTALADLVLLTPIALLLT